MIDYKSINRKTNRKNFSNLLCDDLLPLFYIFVNWMSLGFGWLVEQNKVSDYGTLNSGKRPHFLNSPKLYRLRLIDNENKCLQLYTHLLYARYINNVDCTHACMHAYPFVTCTWALQPVLTVKAESLLLVNVPHWAVTQRLTLLFTPSSLGNTGNLLPPPPPLRLTTLLPRAAQLQHSRALLGPRCSS